MKTVFIYALKDPRTDQIRYIGKTKDLKSRVQKHCSSSHERNHRANWIRCLLRDGLHPSVEILDEVSIEDASSWEVAYIAFFKESGCDLTNSTAGGEGLHNPSPEVSAKIRAAHLGKKEKPYTYAPGAKERIRARGRRLTGDKNPLFGKRHSPETIQKIRAARLGTKLPMELRLRLSEIHRQRWAELKS